MVEFSFINNINGNDVVTSLVDFIKYYYCERENSSQEMMFRSKINYRHWIGSVFQSDEIR